MSKNEEKAEAATEVEPQVEETQIPGGFQDIEEPDEFADTEIVVEDDPEKHIDAEPTDEPSKTPSKEEKPADEGEAASKDAENPSGDDTETKELLPITPELVYRAADLGLTAEDVAEFKDSESLERALRVYERKLISGAVAPQQREQKQPETGKPLSADTDIPDLDPKEYDENIVKGWGTMKLMLKSLEERNKQFETYFQHEQERASDRQFDEHIAKLGDGYSELLGKGTVIEMDHHSEHFKNRLQVREAMYALAGGYHRLGKKIPPEPELFKRALNSVFGDKAAAFERKKISDALNKQKGKMISRPTHRSSSDSRTPMQRAREVIRTKLRDKGLDLPDDNDQF